MSKYSKQVLNKLNEDRLGKKIFCDFIIKTESREFHIHKCLLGLMSDFFRGMFQVEMAEKYQNYWMVKEQLKADTIAIVLDFLYGDPDSVTKDNVQNVVEAADYLQIPQLLEHCVEFISSTLTEKSLFDYWQFAKQYHLLNLAVICRKYSETNFLTLSRRSEVLSLQLTLFEEFLETRSSTKSEERVYETIINWINFDKENRHTHFAKLFDSVDLDQLSTSFLNAEILNNELVLENPLASKKVLLSMRKHLLSAAPAQEHGSSQNQTSCPKKADMPTNLQKKQNECTLNASLKSSQETDDNQKIVDRQPILKWSELSPPNNQLSAEVHSMQKSVGLKENTSVSAVNQPESSSSCISTGLQNPFHLQMKAKKIVQLTLPKIISKTTESSVAAIAGASVKPAVNAQAATAQSQVACSTALLPPPIKLHTVAHVLGSKSKAKQPASTNQSLLQSQPSELVIIGGITSPSYVRKYKVSSNQWSRLPDIDDVCIEGHLARFKTLLYYIGGRLANSLNSYPDMWRLNTSSSVSHWLPCTPMMQKRHRFGCTLTSTNKLYVVGGRAHKTEILCSTESYNVYGDCWTEEPDMNYHRVGCGLVLFKKILMAVGGEIHRNRFTSSVEILSIAGGKKWELSEGLDMQTPRSDFAVAVFNNKIYAIGGKFSENVYLAAVESFNFKEKWNHASPLNTCRAGHSACVLGNKIYVVGGQNQHGPVKSIEMFSLESNKWEVIGDMKGDPIGAGMVAM